MRFFLVLFLLNSCFFLSVYAQNPNGPQQPEMPEREPEIVIRSSAGMQMRSDPENEDQMIVVYNENVRLTHREQRLDLECEKLELYFHSETEEAEEGAVVEEALELEEEEVQEAAAEDPGSQIKKIIATGDVLIVKIGENGETNIARCGTAEYFPDQGFISLSGAPQVQDSTRHVRAVGEEGVIELRENGEHSARDGEFETILLQGASS